MIFRHQYRARWSGNICYVERRIWPLWWNKIGSASDLTNAQALARDDATGPRFTPPRVTPLNPYPVEDYEEEDDIGYTVQPSRGEVILIIIAALFGMLALIFMAMR